MKEPSMVSTLLGFLNNSDVNKVNYVIAEGMLKNFKQISESSIYEMAELCYASPSSLSRFAKKLGFASYVEFKQACKDEIDIDVDYSNKIRKATADDLMPIFQYYANHVKENIQYNLEKVDDNELVEICHLIHDATDVVFLGLEFANIIGQHLQIKLAECNRFVQIKRNGITDMELVENLSENSVAIIASLEGGYLYRQQEVIKKLKSKQAKIIGITMEHNSKLFRDMDYFLFSNKHNSETEGRISLLFTIELLIMAYYINYKY